MAKRGVREEFKKNARHLESHNRLIRVLLFFSVLVFVLMSGLMAYIALPLQSKYFMAKPNAECVKKILECTQRDSKNNCVQAKISRRCAEMESQETPNLTRPAVADWAAIAVTSAYTYNFLQYEEQFAKVRKYFTEAGWKDFIGAVKKNVLQARRDRLEVTAVKYATPIVTAEGDLNGVHYWQVSVPIMISYKSAQTQVPVQYRVVNLFVERISPRLSPRGIGIAQLTESSGNELTGGS